MVKNVPVGIYNNEIFIARIEDGVMASSFDVIRPVSVESLEYLRDRYKREDEYKDFWKQAVAADRTEESFSDWFDSVWDEEYDESDEEDFPGKDNSDVDLISEEERAEADNFLKTKGIEVGTWESSGWYSPGNFHTGNEFHGWEYVFDNPEARKWAEKYEKIAL